MATFPTLSYGLLVMDGASYTQTMPTGMVRFLTGKEQRWISGVPRLSDMELVFTQISQQDLGKLLAFWNQNKGPANATWQVTIDGTTYTNLCFADDATFTPELVQGDLWNLSLKVKQTP